MQKDKIAIFQMRFPQKLWYLLNLRTDAILWGSTGRTILLNHRVLHNYLRGGHSIFKTTNISSFVRQLNLYGFRKVTSHLQDLLCNSKNPFMHEYVHDYFQYGRPELLNKISRKSLTLNRSFKTKIHNDTEHTLYLTPLQKARRALRMALKKAAQDLFMQNSPKQLYGFKFDCEESQDDDYDDEDNIELDCFMPNSEPTSESLLPYTDNTDCPSSNDARKEWVDYEQSQVLMNLTNETNQQTNDGFPGQLLNMPDLDPEPSESKSTIELLAEFGINQDVDAGNINKIEKENVHVTLNCVLPSINNDQNDEIPLADRNNESSDHFNGEWDQMFNDFIINKGVNQECGPDLKQLYSQISKSIDLLNY